MKLNQICDELMELAKQAGYSVRKENGSFHSGGCLLNEQKIIVINRSTPLESLTRILARTVAAESDKCGFIKPAVREYIDKENAAIDGNTVFKLEVDY